MALATLDNVKQLLGQSGTANDTILTALLDRASTVAAQLCGVATLERVADAVVYPWDPRASRYGEGSETIWLRRGPIESVTSVSQRWTLSTAWDDAEALTEDTDYIVLSDAAQLLRINNRWFAAHQRLIRVVATLGYVDPATGAPPAEAIQPPGDLQHAVAEQTQWLWRRRDLVGTSGISLGQGGAVNLREIEVVASLRHAVDALPWRRMF